MLASQIPTKFPIPFGNNAAAGTIRPIPQASQTASSPGQASLYDGFPLATGQPLASGGVPPAMQDFNGLLNQITAWSRWQNAGAPVQFDQAFCASIGGYPQGAVVASTVMAGRLWISTADNNLTNPDGANPTNWTYLALPSDVTVVIQPSLARGCLAARINASTVSIPNGTTETAFPFNAKLFDTDSVLNLTGDPTKFVIPAGVSRVRVQTQVLWEANSSGFRKFRVLRNGNIEGGGLQSGRVLASTSDDVTIQNGCGAIIAASPGDYLQLMVSQGSGNALTIRGDGNTWMNVEILK